MSKFTYDDDIFSDMFKDAYGFRPRAHEYYDAAPERKQEIWDAVYEDVLASINMQADIEARAVEEFEKEINDAIEVGAGDRKTALRWLTQSDIFYNVQCVESWVWSRDMLFTKYGRKLVDELMNIVEFNKVEYV